MEAAEAAKNALSCVLQAEKSETVTIFCDDEKLEIGEAFTTGAMSLGLRTRLTVLKTEPNSFRKDVPSQALKALKQTPAIYINILRGIREEAPFRIRLIKLETEEHKSRLGHCPGITMDMLTEGALAFTAAGHLKMQKSARSLMKALHHAIQIEITNPAGTKLSLRVDGRSFFTDTVIDKKTMKWMNLPTGEVLAAPIENSLNGELVCDMAIGGVGPIETPVVLTVRNGKVQQSNCKNERILKRVRDSLSTDGNSNIVGEFAFGINPKARFVDEFLEAEKILGTIHIAFGNNSDFPGGQNPSRNHLDFLMSKPTVDVLNKDNSKKRILSEGVLDVR
jgi:aminopeptidase